MKFKKEFLIEELWFHDKTITISDKIVNKRRWSIDHERIFSFEGKLYRT
jgi:hypothetical protein